MQRNGLTTPRSCVVASLLVTAMLSAPGHAQLASGSNAAAGTGSGAGGEVICDWVVNRCMPTTNDEAGKKFSKEEELETGCILTDVLDSSTCGERAVDQSLCHMVGEVNSVQGGVCVSSQRTDLTTSQVDGLHNSLNIISSESCWNYLSDACVAKSEDCEPLSCTCIQANADYWNSFGCPECAQVAAKTIPFWWSCYEAADEASCTATKPTHLLTGQPYGSAGNPDPGCSIDSTPVSTSGRSAPITVPGDVSAAASFNAALTLRILGAACAVIMVAML